MSCLSVCEIQLIFTKQERDRALCWFEELGQALRLAKTGKYRISRENRSNSVFVLTDFSTGTWYQVLDSDGFFLLSNSWRILFQCFQTKHFKINSVTLQRFFGISDGYFFQQGSFCSVIICGKHPNNLSPVLFVL